MNKPDIDRLGTVTLINYFHSVPTINGFINAAMYEPTEWLYNTNYYAKNNRQITKGSQQQQGGKVKGETIRRRQWRLWEKFRIKLKSFPKQEK
tara:strand:+ start:942 stop:1220 length:279 start_codon:yes stop_codon:yes gene_type:complete